MLSNRNTWFNHDLHGVAGHSSGAETVSKMNCCFLLNKASLDIKNYVGEKKDFLVLVSMKGIIFACKDIKIQSTVIKKKANQVILLTGN